MPRGQTACAVHAGGGPAGHPRQLARPDRVGSGLLSAPRPRRALFRRAIPTPLEIVAFHSIERLRSADSNNPLQHARVRTVLGPCDFAPPVPDDVGDLWSRTVMLSMNKR